MSSREVLVLGVPFIFERPPFAHMDGNDGQVDFSRGAIQVADHVPAKQVLEVFTHEYLEAADKLLELKLPHDVICKLDIIFVNLISEAKRIGLA